MTTLLELRQKQEIKIPSCLRHLSSLVIEKMDKKTAIDREIAHLLPQTADQAPLRFTQASSLDHSQLKVGVVLSGGQAAGGHNVIIGIYDALQSMNASSQLIGFIGGPSGVIDDNSLELTKEKIAPFKNSGGFDLIGSGRTKIETPEQFAAAADTLRKHDLDGLVIIGGDDSNTNAALLAEYCLKEGMKTRVIGVPKTIDGDLKNEDIEISFGFDTASKMFSETIGSIARDALSAGKYYFFIKLMGRSASHIALECALQTQVNYTVISEEVAEKKQTIKGLIKEIADMVCARAEKGKHYGVILIPEGVIEFIPEFKALISELNELLCDKDNAEALDKFTAIGDKIDFIVSKISHQAGSSYKDLPVEIQSQLIMDRDPHGNVQVSKIETERLLISLVKEELKNRKIRGQYEGKFNAQPYFCGYEGRSCFPSEFDCRYCYVLGHVAALLIDAGATGYMATVKNLSAPVEDWQIFGAPIASMMHIEMRKGKEKPVIEKALVDLNGQCFKKFECQREHWLVDDCYRYPGPVQFYGPESLTEATTWTLQTSVEEKTSKLMA